MRVTGIEPAQPCGHKNLNLARLPVPPHPRMPCFALRHLSYHKKRNLSRLFLKKLLTNRKKIVIIHEQVKKRQPAMEKYSRGRRGAPAKGVGRLKPAREFKSLLLRHQKAVVCSADHCFFHSSSPAPKTVLRRNRSCLIFRRRDLTKTRRGIRGSHGGRRKRGFRCRICIDFDFSPPARRSMR